MLRVPLSTLNHQEGEWIFWVIYKNGYPPHISEKGVMEKMSYIQKPYLFFPWH